MAYVFGVNVPLMELLLIFLILLTAGLALVLVELRRLRELLSEEKMAVRHFEEDLARFETDEGKIHTEALRAYVKAALARGMTKEQIIGVLKQKGYDERVIAKFF